MSHVCLCHHLDWKPCLVYLLIEFLFIKIKEGIFEEVDDNFKFIASFTHGNTISSQANSYTHAYVLMGLSRLEKITKIKISILSIMHNITEKIVSTDL